MFLSHVIKEYVPTLQTHKRWNKPQRNMQATDIVIAMDDNNRRSYWPLARIIEAFPEKDGIVGSLKSKSELN